MWITSKNIYKIEKIIILILIIITVIVALEYFSLKKDYNGKLEELNAWCEINGLTYDPIDEVCIQLVLDPTDLIPQVEGMTYFYFTKEIQTFK